MKPTQEQVVAWGRKAGLQCAKNYDYRGSYEAMPLLEQQDFDKVLLALTLAYEAGRKERTMTTLREAAQMALQALEWSYDVTEWPANGKTPQDKAIEALRAALAQPEQEIKCQHKFEVDEDAPLHSCCQICGEVRKQPEQEPPCKTGSQCVSGKCERCALEFCQHH